MTQILTDEIDVRPVWNRMGRQDRNKTGLAIAAGATTLLLAVALWPNSEPEPRARKFVPRSLPTPELALAIQAPANDRLIVTRSDSPLEAPKADAAPALGAEPGALQIESDPSELSVYEGERRLGKTPLSVRLPAGSHTLRFVDKKRFIESERRYQVRAGGDHKSEVNIGVGKLKVDAPDGAKVYVDKKLVGTAPLDTFELSEGRHRLRIKGASGEMEETLNVQPSRTITYRTSLSD